MPVIWDHASPNERATFEAMAEVIDLMEFPSQGIGLSLRPWTARDHLFAAAVLGDACARNLRFLALVLEKETPEPTELDRIADNELVNELVRQTILLAQDAAHHAIMGGL